MFGGLYWTIVGLFLLGVVVRACWFLCVWWYYAMQVRILQGERQRLLALPPVQVPVKPVEEKAVAIGE